MKEKRKHETLFLVVYIAFLRYIKTHSLNYLRGCCISMCASECAYIQLFVYFFVVTSRKKKCKVRLVAISLFEYANIDSRNPRGYRDCRSYIQYLQKIFSRGGRKVLFTFNFYLITLLYSSLYLFIFPASVSRVYGHVLGITRIENSQLNFHGDFREIS